MDRDRQGHQDLSVSNRNLTPLQFVCYFSLITTPTLYRLAPKHTSREVSNQLYKYSYPLITVAVPKGFRVLCRPSYKAKEKDPAALSMESGSPDCAVFQMSIRRISSCSTYPYVFLLSQVYPHSHCKYAEAAPTRS